MASIGVPKEIKADELRVALTPDGTRELVNQGLEVRVQSKAGAGAGIGIVFGSLINSVARNPSLTKQLFGYAILGFALTEAIALFALMMAFLILFVF